MCLGARLRPGPGLQARLPATVPQAGVLRSGPGLQARLPAAVPEASSGMLQAGPGVLQSSPGMRGSSELLQICSFV